MKKKIICPFCKSKMIEHAAQPAPRYSCSNPKCRCGDGGQTFYEKPWPIQKIESKRKQMERQAARNKENR